jgi:hypothetical protein
MATQSSSRNRGSTVQNPANTKYSLWSWIKGYAAWALVFPLYCFLWAFARVFKRVPNWLLRKLLRDHQRVTEGRNPDVRIPGDPTIPPYMLRWWKIKRNAFFNCYYHIVRRSDEDRALHDHPWWNFSIVLAGSYYEHLIANGGVNTKTKYGPGAVRFRPSGTFAHRLELETRREHGGLFTGPRSVANFRDVELPVHTIFITGPVLRRWGFHHPDQWVDAYDFDRFCEERGIGSTRMAGYAAQQVKG